MDEEIFDDFDEKYVLDEDFALDNLDEFNYNYGDEE